MAAKLPNRSLPWPITWEGVTFIAGFEKCRLEAYRSYDDEPWTCGWGETQGVGPTTVWTQEYADQRFCDSLSKYTEDVRNECTKEPTPEQLAAMVSLAYNIGMGWKGKKKPNGANDGFRQSTVLKRHNQGDYVSASRAFGLWNMRKGKVNAGLTSRRAAESAIYLPADTDEHPMPQVVDPESKPVTGPIAVSSIGTAAVGVVGLAKEAGDQIGAISTPLNAVRSFAADTLGLPPAWLPWLIIIILSGIVIYWRLKQRHSGNA